MGVGSRTDQQWSKPTEKKLTGGNNWQNPTMAPSTVMQQPMVGNHTTVAARIRRDVVISYVFKPKTVNSSRMLSVFAN